MGVVDLITWKIQSVSPRVGPNNSVVAAVLSRIMLSSVDEKMLSGRLREGYCRY
jgi:hypothetical protein